MNNEKILEAVESKMSGDIDKDYDFLLQEATHFVKLGLPDLVTPILSLLEKKYGDGLYAHGDYRSVPVAVEKASEEACCCERDCSSRAIRRQRKPP